MINCHRPIPVWYAKLAITCLKKLRCILKISRKMKLLIIILSLVMGKDWQLPTIWERWIKEFGIRPEGTSLFFIMKNVPMREYQLGVKIFCVFIGENEQIFVKTSKKLLVIIQLFSLFSWLLFVKLTRPKQKFPNFLQPKFDIFINEVKYFNHG